MPGKERDYTQGRTQHGVEVVQNRPSVTGQNYSATYQGNYAVPGVAYNSANHYDVMAQTEKKSLVEAYLLWFFFGILGAHHFYLRRTEWGILYFFTGSLLGCGWLIDLFRLPCLVARVNKSTQDETSVERKNISDAYTLWFPFGLLGFHHFYLENPLMGGLYFLTGGLFGIGWLVDLVRIPSLVKEANLRDTSVKQEKNVGAAYALGVSPFGILGFHHFYLNRPLWGFMYVLTGGLCGIGWLVDWFRIPVLVKRTNKEINLGPDGEKHLDDAYILWFPMGLLGFHHFYLRRPVWGFVYFLTGGLFGIGWIVDGLRMPCLVTDSNRLERERAGRLPIYQVPYSGSYPAPSYEEQPPPYSSPDDA